MRFVRQTKKIPDAVFCGESAAAVCGCRKKVAHCSGTILSILVGMGRRIGETRKDLQGEWTAGQRSGKRPPPSSKGEPPSMP